MRFKDSFLSFFVAKAAVQPERVLRAIGCNGWFDDLICSPTATVASPP
jgi:hypothetical protein